MSEHVDLDALEDDLYQALAEDKRVMDDMGGQFREIQAERDEWKQHYETECAGSWAQIERIRNLEAGLKAAKAQMKRYHETNVRLATVAKDMYRKWQAAERKVAALERISTDRLDSLERHQNFESEQQTQIKELRIRNETLLRWKGWRY